MSTSNCSHPCCQGDTCRRKAPAKKQRMPIKRNTPIKRYSAKPKQKNDELETFFADCMDIIAKHPYCANCNSWISPQYYRHAVAHILFKKIFKSVASHPLNWLQLGANCGCHEKTHVLDKFSKMPIFKIAVERFRQFEPMITEHHKILDAFKQYADDLCPIKN